MGLKDIVAGLILVGVAFVLAQIAIPWITFTPLPTLTTLHPLQPFAMVFYIIGGILVVFGITQSTMLRIFLSALIVMGILWVMFKVAMPFLV